MDKEELLRKIMELPKEESKNSATSFCGINVEDLMITINRFDKIPTYDELLRENKKQKEVIDKLEKKIKVVKEYAFDKVGRYELLEILKEVSE